MAENGIDVKPAAGANAGAEIFVARSERLLGSIIVADTIRSEAEGAIKALHRMGLRTILLTGDSRRVADAVGSKLGIKRLRPSCCLQTSLEEFARSSLRNASLPWLATA
jgi:Cd2+/Zn2+-exporting ATPase/Cu+-exporting ATPase